MVIVYKWQIIESEQFQAGIIRRVKDRKKVRGTTYKLFIKPVCYEKNREVCTLAHCFFKKLISWN